MCNRVTELDQRVVDTESALFDLHSNVAALLVGGGEDNRDAVYASLKVAKVLLKGSSDPADLNKGTP